MRFGKTEIQLKVLTVWAERIAAAGLFVAFWVMAYRASWLSDDAYIAFRTVDNFVGGYGLTWNTGERVQGFTCPLWVLTLSFFYFFSGEIFFTSHFLQLAISAVAVLLLVTKISRTPRHGLMALSALCLSKTFVDFSTSGLENALIHLVLVSFFIIYIQKETKRRLLYLSLLFSAALLTRMDTMLLFLPPYAYAVVCRIRDLGLRSAKFTEFKYVFVGIAPFLGWEIFSIVYFGFPFPNTAYAKIGTGIPFGESFAQGVHYLHNSWTMDPLTLFCIGLSVLLTVVRHKPRGSALAVGMALYLFYVVRVGGDFMSGRFLSALFVSAVILLSRVEVRWTLTYALVLSLLFVGLAAAAFFPSFNDGYERRFKTAKDANGIVDAKRTGIRKSGLRYTNREHPLPNFDWVKRGKKMKQKNRSYSVLGGIGYTGFYAGPQIHIIDVYGLTEPLFARLPAGKPVHGKRWRIGHFRRPVPEGYRDTLKKKKNVIADPHLAQYFEKLQLIVAGPIFSLERFRTIAEMNLGRYDPLVKAYVAATPALWLDFK